MAGVNYRNTWHVRSPTFQIWASPRNVMKLTSRFLIMRSLSACATTFYFSRWHSFSIFHKFNIELDVFECFVKATFCNFSFVCYSYSCCNQTVASCECKVIPKVLVTFDVELRGQFAVARCRYK